MFGYEQVYRLRSTGDIDPYTGSPSSPSREPMWTTEPPAPRTASEDVRSDRTASVEGWTLFFPNGSDVQRTDQIEVRGDVFDVDGEPADWPGEDLLVQTTRPEG